MAALTLPAGADVASGVYGQILVTALVASLSEYHGASPAEIFSAVAVTVPVFWVAHVFADAEAQRLRQARPLRVGEVLSVARYRWPMAQSALPALLALALGWAGVVSPTVSIDLALGVGVAALVALGLVIARRSKLSPLATVGAVCLNGAFGLAIVALKVMVE